MRVQNLACILKITFVDVIDVGITSARSHGSHHCWCLPENYASTAKVWKDRRPLSLTTGEIFRNAHFIGGIKFDFIVSLALAIGAERG